MNEELLKTKVIERKIKTIATMQRNEEFLEGQICQKKKGTTTPEYDYKKT
jgi:hypothetical protein